jgi:glycosyltransferase involved in cell wall biosynthesis
MGKKLAQSFIFMKILIIGSDRLLFKEGSAVEKRIKTYASFLERLDIIVFTGRGYAPQNLSSSVFIYPTNGFCRLLSLFRAFRIGGKLSRPDIVSAQDPFEAGLVAWLIARKHKTKIELQFHTDPFAPYFLKNSFLNFFRVIIMRFLIPRADHFRVVSRGIAEALVIRGAPKEKITILPIFVAPPEEKKNEVEPTSLPAFSHTTLMVSRLSKEKNISLAIHAFKKALEENSAAGLIILGDGPERKNLEKLADMLGIKEKVFFAGWRENLYPFYKKANLYLLTSDYEGFGRTFIEAAHMKVPILSTSVGIAKEVGARIVRPDELSSVLSRVVSGKEKINSSHLPAYWYSSEGEYIVQLQNNWQKILC